MNNLVIAIDGPAGAGKSTIAKIIAKELNINYIYRSNVSCSNFKMFTK